MSQTISITGVPEHFNLPWHLALEEGAFSARGIDLEWTDTPEGTGKMVQMLESGIADLAIILTEGVVKAISAGLEASIVQQYVGTPLHWGIHVAVSSPFQRIDQLENRKAAISRFGSGSHLMAFVHARKEGWALDTLRFEVVNNLQGAIEALSSGAADYFMWERFTTQPLVDDGVFRRLGICPTPWPCFVIAARNSFLRENGRILADILEVINTYTGEFRRIPSIDRTLANRYGQRLESIREWLSLTRWSQDKLSTEDIEKVITTMSDLNLLSKSIKPEDLIA